MNKFFPSGKSVSKRFFVLKIIIDSRWIRSLKIDGIANFTINVTKELLKSDNNNDYLLLTHSDEVSNFIKKSLGNITGNFYKMSCNISSLNNIFEVPKLISYFKPEIYFSPCFPYFSFFIKNCEHIGVIHDLIPLIFPEMFNNASIKFKITYSNKYFQKFNLNNSSRIITVSQSTKNDLVNYLNISDEKIRIISEGCNLKNEPEILTEHLKTIYKITGEYFLFIGRHEKYKNISKLINIYGKLPDNIKSKYQLVIVGSFNEYTATLFEQAKNLINTKRIIFIDSVLPDKLPLFYKNARVLLHLSLYEGFGLTILEAMNSGLPVICSNVSSIPEVAGDAGILVDPDDDELVVNSIIKLTTDEKIYNELSVKGMERAKNFTWEKSAKQLSEVFDEFN